MQRTWKWRDWGQEEEVGPCADLVLAWLKETKTVLTKDLGFMYTQSTLKLVTNKHPLKLWEIVSLECLEKGREIRKADS